MPPKRTLRSPRSPNRPPMLSSRTLYQHPDSHDDLDVSSILAATLVALGSTPRRYGDAVAIKTTYSTRRYEAVAPPPASTVEYEYRANAIERPRYAPSSSQPTTMVDWREEAAEEQERVEAMRERERRGRRTG